MIRQRVLHGSGAGSGGHGAAAGTQHSAAWRCFFAGVPGQSAGAGRTSEETLMAAPAVGHGLGSSFASNLRAVSPTRFPDTFPEGSVPDTFPVRAVSPTRPRHVSPTRFLRAVSPTRFFPSHFPRPLPRVPDTFSVPDTFRPLPECPQPLPECPQPLPSSPPATSLQPLSVPSHYSHSFQPLPQPLAEIARESVRCRFAAQRSGSRRLEYGDQRITLDLDDRVKVNYAKFGDLLAESKAICGTKEPD